MLHISVRPFYVGAIVAAAIAVDGSTAQVDMVAKAPLSPAADQPHVEQPAPKPSQSTGLMQLPQTQCLQPNHPGWPAEDLATLVRNMQPSLSPENAQQLVAEHSQLYEDARLDLPDQDVSSITKVTTICLMHTVGSTAWSISFPSGKTAYQGR